MKTRKNYKKKRSASRAPRGGYAQYLWTFCVAAAVAVAAIHQGGFTGSAPASTASVNKELATQAPAPVATEASRVLSSLQGGLPDTH